MNCSEKTTLKLTSNIICKNRNQSVGLYIPMEMKSKEYKDVRLEHYLSKEQKRQIIKKTFYADDVWEDEERYPNKPENTELCANCPCRDICY